MNINPIKSNYESKIFHFNTIKKMPSFKEDHSKTFVLENSNEKVKNNNFLKSLLGVAFIGALIIEIIIEHKSNITARIEKEAIEKAKKELEKEKELLENKLRDYNIKIKDDNNITINLKEKVNILPSNANEFFNPEKIIGYNEEKNLIFNKLISPILKKQENDIPNIFVLYGPKGTGKSFLVDSFTSNECFNTYTLETLLEPKKDIEVLNTVLNQAELNYQKTGKWNFLRIDEFDYFLNSNNEEIIETYRNILKNLTKNHTTLIATTNFPQNLDLILLNTEKYKMLYIPPIKDYDLPILLEYYAKNFVEDSINYNELSEIILNKSENGSYSNDKLKDIIKKINIEINNITDLDTPSRLLNQQDLKLAFEDSKPNISKEMLNFYKTFSENFNIL